MFLCICINFAVPLYGIESQNTEVQFSHNNHTSKKRKKKKRSHTWVKIAGVSVATAMTASFLYMLTRNGSSKKTMPPETPKPAQNIPPTPQSTHETLSIETSVYDRHVLDKVLTLATHQLPDDQKYSKIDKKHWSSVIEFVEESSLSLEQTLLVHVLHQDHKKSKQLITANADINYSHENGITPLAIALEKQDYPMVKLLIDAKADVNIDCPKWYKYSNLEDGLFYGTNRPIFHALNPTHNQPILKALIEANADINGKVNSHFQSPLEMAVDHHLPNAVKYLLEQKANVHTITPESNVSIVQRCAWAPNKEIMQLLIAAKANPHMKSNDKDSGSKTALDLLIWKSKQPQKYSQAQNTEIKACLELLSAIPQA